MKKLIPCLFLLTFLTSDCFRPHCEFSAEGEHGECITYFPGQERITGDIDRALELYADNLQQVLMNMEIGFTDTAIVRTCATPDLIRSNLDQLELTFTEKPFSCKIDNVWVACLGTSLYGEIKLSWAEKLSDTAFVHELHHWVDELCGVAIEWNHVRTDWWDSVELMNDILRENGL